MIAEAEPLAPAPTASARFLGRSISPLTRRRLDSFCRNRRGFWSLWIFLALFTITLFSEFISNDRPILIHYDDHWYFPVVADYPETTFGGEFPTAADYRDPAVQQMISQHGWMVWPPIPFSYNTINYRLTSPAPSPP
ncbi:MAG: ABC transporter permease, partial [Stellaceae bacterium]